ncbi:MAG: MBL fold metallo-hydrolase [Bryobacterales bacterium]|nr:MBL fold metallo-hydrolase [Bryobacteraceae bacterium]MDW8130703.1 MBL fold metallo-hydrolase [Bryobacterales bacterium]
MVRLCVLASGSSGNATLVASARTRLLVDAGLSAREIERRLALAGESLERLDAILVTHEHTDHVSGLTALARRAPCPVFLTALTAAAIAWNGEPPPLELFPAGARWQIGDIEVTSFSVPHDASDPVGYCFQAEGRKIAIVTDLGYIPDAIRFQIRGADLLVLESNHDLEMLKVGPYPWPVKQRVMSRQGHLSNDAVAQYIRSHLEPCTRTLVLAHLSENNNHPDLVRLVASQALRSRGLSTRLVVVEQRCQTEVFEL